ncbi:MAG: ribosome silencing factor [Ruminococcaceae bacterium]|nr:ribosome silencing factor [Oscillospiraceae bacterium]
MTSLELAKKIAFSLDDKKARNINVIKVSEISSLADYFVIAAGNSSTQVHALSDNVEATLKEIGIEPISVEGYRSQGWIILDYASVLVHVFTQETRDFYDLDRLWSDGIKVDIDYNKN